MHWKGLSTAVIIAGLAALTLSLQIGTLIDGQNRFETYTLNNLQDISTLKERAVNAPYMISAYAVGKLVSDPLLGARITSVIFGLLSTLLLFAILKRWFNIRTAAIGSLLFITSAWLLSISHQATPLIMLVFTPLLLMLAITKYVNSKEKAFSAFMFLVFALGIAVYVPYMFWIILITLLVLIFVYKTRIVAINSQGLLIASIVFVLLVAPLAYSLYLHPGQIKELLGIPVQLPTITDYLANFFKQFAAIFVYTERFPELFIYQKPLLDIFSSVMLVLGIYHFYKFMPKRRKITLALTLTVLLLIIPLHKEYLIPLTAILPFVYIFIPAGIHELIRQWYYVFPRNPFARTSAAIILVMVIGLSVTYNLQKFYIAWPNTPETRAAYMIESKQ